MKQLDEVKISYYENKYGMTNVAVSLYNLLSDIKVGRWMQQILAVRRYVQAGDEEAAQQLKNELPAFTVCGLFNGSHSKRNLQRHNGFIIIDFDHVKDLPRLIDICKNDAHTAASFLSPRDGYKVLAHVESAETRHAEAYETVVSYYRALTGLEIDDSGKDESRICFVSYDPDIYVAAIYTSFSLPENEEIPAGDSFPISAEEPSPSEEPFPAEESSLPGDKTSSPGGEDEFVKSYLFLNPLRKGNRNNILFKLACEAAKRAYDIHRILAALYPVLAVSGMRQTEANAAVRSGYKHIRENETFSDTPPDARFGGVKPPKPPYDGIQETEDDENRYWEGEDLREKTPLFPDELFENIPNIMKDGMLPGISSRERDVLLLSELIAYSSIQPSTWCNYAGKRYSANLYAMCVAPAGSGKSIAALGAELLSVVNDRLMEESELALKNYKKQRAEWMMRCARGFKNNGENEDPGEEPQEPPYKMLMIPSTTSNSRLQIQLRDNGGEGNIIFDTEAQTLANANQMDCGHFEHILCKAYGHENISSSYKVNGMKPIVITHPQLSIMLTGTNEQLYRVIENPANGLFSRFLFYTYRSSEGWRDVSDSGVVYDDLFEDLAHRAFEQYKFCKEHPLKFGLTQSQWGTINCRFRKLLLQAEAEGNEDMSAVVKRYALMVMRIGMIFTRLRQFENHSLSASVTCSDVDFRNALSIISCCYSHSRLLITSWPKNHTFVLKNPDFHIGFIEALPKVFTTEEAIETGRYFSFSERTVSRLIKLNIGLKIKKIGHGKYEKLP